MALEALKRNGHNLQLGGYETDGPTASRALRRQRLTGRFPLFRSTVQRPTPCAPDTACIFSSTTISLSASGTILSVTRRC